MNSPLFTLINFLQGEGSALYVALMFFSIISVTLILLPFHECAHALSAYWLGDNTANEEGRLTLNPLRHVDPIGFGCMFLIGFGWAKPVPVNPLRASRKVSMRTFIALTAAAGPVSNILFTLVCLIASKIIYITAIPSEITAALNTSNFTLYEKFQILALQFSDHIANPTMAYLGFALMMMGSISLFLAVFNLIPIPPLDGSKILFFFLNNRQIQMMEQHMHIIRTVLLIVLISTSILQVFIGTVSGYIMLGLDYATFFIK